MNHLNEETIMEVIADLMNGGQLENFDIDAQMVVVELISTGIRKYHTKELDKFLEGLHRDYHKDKLSDL
ncbi:MAG: hypothetical protein Unbinned8261contig1001_16 [Prokaryotic dsDNA virus sp.]|nr:MAG: hypothetical protein Unbinned8261contig1001_16 [Prokaryotic dsDNA virus sp.]|tara:strand:- start:20698 stop:20904 length:207 start_codon:yes stop_codon:yes gene_type:complete